MYDIVDTAYWNEEQYGNFVKQSLFDDIPSKLPRSVICFTRFNIDMWKDEQMKNWILYIFLDGSITYPKDMPLRERIYGAAGGGMTIVYNNIIIMSYPIPISERTHINIAEFAMFIEAFKIIIEKKLMDYCKVLQLYLIHKIVLTK